MRTVLKLGGYLFPSPLDPKLLRETSSIVREAYKEHASLKTEPPSMLVVVTGGGSLARSYIKALRELGISEYQLDLIGIYASRIHAYLFAFCCGSFAISVESLSDVFKYANMPVTPPLLVMGGVQPGQSTTTVAAAVAELVNADRLIVATDVDGVFTADPKKDPSAKRLPSISFEQLMELSRKSGYKAGTYQLFDPIAARIVARSRITTAVINGTKLENLRKALSVPKTKEEENAWVEWVKSVGTLIR